MTTEEQIDNILLASTNEPYGDLKVSILKEAVRESDAAQIEYMSFKSRIFLMEAAVFSGYGELALIHFPWIESTYRKNPGTYEPSTFNWMYSWMAILMSYCPDIRLVDIQKVLEALEKAFLSQGKSERTLYEIQRTVWIILGQEDIAAKYQAKFELTEYPGHWAFVSGRVNHRAIELHNESYYYTRIGQYEKARKIIEPVLSREIEFPLSQPYSIAAALILLVRAGEYAEGERQFQEGIRLVWGKRQYKNLHPDFLVFATMKGDFAKGVSLFEVISPLLETSPIGLEQFEHCKASRFLFSQMHHSGIASLKLKLPQYHPLYLESSEYNTAELAEWYLNKAREWAEKFDLRNENDSISQMLEESLKYHELAFTLE